MTFNARCEGRTCRETRRQLNENEFRDERLVDIELVLYDESNRRRPVGNVSLLRHGADKEIVQNMEFTVTIVPQPRTTKEEK